MKDTTESAPERRLPPRLLTAVFAATVLVFLILFAFIFLQELIPNNRVLFRYLFLPGVALMTVLGLVLLVLAARAGLERELKLALVLTGVGAVGIPLSMILHNAVYALMVFLSNKGVLNLNRGGDEGLFFILALVIFPALLVVSAAFSMVMLWRANRAAGG